MLGVISAITSFLILLAAYGDTGAGILASFFTVVAIGFVVDGSA